MSKRLEWNPGAEDDLENLDSVVHERIIRDLNRLAEDGYGRLTPLRGRGRQQRLRVGDWRVILEIIDEENTILVISIQHRREVYRR